MVDVLWSVLWVYYVLIYMSDIIMKIDITYTYIPR